MLAVSKQTYGYVFIWWYIYMHTVVFISDSQPFASKPMTNLLFSFLTHSHLHPSPRPICCFHFWLTAICIQAHDQSVVFIFDWQPFASKPTTNLLFSFLIDSHLHPSPRPICCFHFWFTAICIQAHDQSVVFIFDSQPFASKPTTHLLFSFLIDSHLHPSPRPICCFHFWLTAICIQAHDPSVVFIFDWQPFASKPTTHLLFSFLIDSHLHPSPRPICCFHFWLTAICIQAHDPSVVFIFDSQPFASKPTTHLLFSFLIDSHLHPSPRPICCFHFWLTAICIQAHDPSVVFIFDWQPFASKPTTHLLFSFLIHSHLHPSPRPICCFHFWLTAICIQAHDPSVVFIFDWQPFASKPTTHLLFSFLIHSHLHPSPRPICCFHFWLTAICIQAHDPSVVFIFDWQPFASKPTTHLLFSFLIDSHLHPSPRPICCFHFWLTAICIQAHDPSVVFIFDWQPFASKPTTHLLFSFLIDSHLHPSPRPICCFHFWFTAICIQAHDPSVVFIFDSQPFASKPTTNLLFSFLIHSHLHPSPRPICCFHFWLTAICIQAHDPSVVFIFDWQPFASKPTTNLLFSFLIDSHLHPSPRPICCFHFWLTAICIQAHDPSVVFIFDWQPFASKPTTHLLFSFLIDSHLHPSPRPICCFHFWFTAICIQAHDPSVVFIFDWQPFASKPTTHLLFSFLIDSHLHPSPRPICCFHFWLTAICIQAHDPSVVFIFDWQPFASKPTTHLLFSFLIDSHLHPSPRPICCFHFWLTAICIQAHDPSVVFIFDWQPFASKPTTHLLFSFLIDSHLHPSPRPICCFHFWLTAICIQAHDPSVVFIFDWQPFASKPTTHLCRWCQWSLRVLRQVFPWRSAPGLCWRRWVSSWGCVCRLHAAYKVTKWLHKRMVGTPWWRAAYKVEKWLYKGLVGTLRWRGAYKVAKWLQKRIEDGGTTFQAVFMATMFLTVTVKLH